MNTKKPKIERLTKQQKQNAFIAELLKEYKKKEGASNHALKFYPLIKKWNDTGKQYTKDNHSIHLGNYTVNSFKNGVLTVGCHDIPYSEIKRIAELLKLEA